KGRGGSEAAAADSPCDAVGADVATDVGTHSPQQGSLPAGTGASPSDKSHQDDNQQPKRQRLSQKQRVGINHPKAQVLHPEALIEQGLRPPDLLNRSDFHHEIRKLRCYGITNQHREELMDACLHVIRNDSPLVDVRDRLAAVRAVLAMDEIEM